MTTFSLLSIQSMSRYIFVILVGPYSSLFVKIRFYMPPLCRVQSTAFNIFTHGV